MSNQHLPCFMAPVMQMPQTPLLNPPPTNWPPSQQGGASVVNSRQAENVSPPAKKQKLEKPVFR